VDELHAWHFQLLRRVPFSLPSPVGVPFWTSLCGEREPDEGEQGSDTAVVAVGGRQGVTITGRQEAKTKVGRLWNGLAGTDGNSIEAVPLNDLGYIEA